MNRQSKQASHKTRHLAGFVACALFAGQSNATLGYCATGASLTAGKSNTSATYQAVTEQSGIKAGGDAQSGGFNITVSGQTTLTGGVITSTDQAVQNTARPEPVEGLGVNSFTSAGGGVASISATDLTNTASYKATSSSITAGVGSALSSSGAGTGSAKGNETTITVSGISGITTAGAGSAAVRTTDTPAPVLSNTFAQNKDAIKANVGAQVQITQQFGQAAVPAAAKFADSQAIKARQSGNEEEAKKWDEGGAYRALMHTALGGLTGGLSGAVGAGGSAVAIPYIGEEIAKLNLPEVVRQGLTQVAGLAVGAALTGGAAAGGATALNQTALNYVSHSPFGAVRTAVSKENARLNNECGSNCTLAQMRAIDLQMQKVEAAGNLAQIAQNSKLTTEQALRMGEVMASLLPVYGNALGVYQAITGKGAFTGEDLSTTERILTGVLSAIPAGSVAYTTLKTAATEAKAAAELAKARVTNNFYAEGAPISYGRSRVVTNPNEAVFWSGLGKDGDKAAMEYVKTNGGTTLEMLANARQLNLPDYNRAIPETVAAWENASKAYAANASGSVRAVVGDGLRVDSVWMRLELPALKANPSVTEIVTINPITGLQTVIFKRTK
jgi:hypothetical protein